MKRLEIPIANLLLTLENGSRPAGGVSAITEGIPSVGGEHLNKTGNFSFKNLRYVPLSFFGNMNRGRIQKGDVLVVKDGATTGKTAYVSDTFPYDKAAVNEHVFILRPDAQKLLPKFLFYFLYSPTGQSRILANYHGAAIGGINQSFASNVKIYVPPIAEQERLVRLLDEADALRRLRARTDERMSDFIPALFHEMFGDLANNSKSWQIYRMGEICTEIYRYPTFYGFEYVNSGIPVVRIGNILKNGSIDPNVANYVYISSEIAKRFPRTQVQKHDILMAVRGDGSTGKRIGLVNNEALIGANISPNLLRFHANTGIINPLFLFAFMISKYGQALIDQNITRTAKKTITATDIANIKIPTPPLSVQDEFAERVTEARALEEKQAQSAARLEALFESMLAQAFSGEL